MHLLPEKIPQNALKIWLEMKIETRQNHAENLGKYFFKKKF